MIGKAPQFGIVCATAFVSLQKAVKSVVHALGGNRPSALKQGFAVKKRSQPNPVTLPVNSSIFDPTGINQLAKLCKEEGIALVLLEPPNSSIFNETLTNRDERMDQFTMSTTYQEATTLFFNENIGYLDQEKDYASQNHLNVKGQRNSLFFWEKHCKKR